MPALQHCDMMKVGTNHMEDCSMDTKSLSKLLHVPDMKKCLILLAVLSILDVVFTHHFLSAGVEEANPILSWPIENYGDIAGIAFIVSVKLLFVCMFIRGYQLVGEYNIYIKIGLNLSMPAYLYMTFTQIDVFLVNIKYVEIPLDTLVVLHF